VNSVKKILSVRKEGKDPEEIVLVDELEDIRIMIGNAIARTEKLVKNLQWNKLPPEVNGSYIRNQLETYVIPRLIDIVDSKKIPGSFVSLLSHIYKRI